MVGNGRTCVGHSRQVGRGLCDSGGGKRYVVVRKGTQVKGVVQVGEGSVVSG